MSLKIALQRIQRAKKLNLKKLDLSKLELNEIPKEISDLNTLTSLNLNINKVKEISNLENLTNLNNLDLSNNKISEIKGLDKLNKLEKLLLSNNQISEIKGLNKLNILVRLKLDGNKIQEIKGLDIHEKIEYLFLERNKIEEVSNLEKLPNLFHLLLNNNKISHVKGLGTKDKLQLLYLHKNQLTNTNGLNKLKSLDTLSLIGNKIKDVSNLKDLSRLKALWISDNEITNLPVSLLKLNLPISWQDTDSEDGICVADNPFTTPPIDVIKSGNEAIREYYEQKEKGVELLLEAKVILLGDGRSGKTSFANRLLGKELPTQADRTKGVDIVIGKYEFDIKAGKKFKLNIWDFAGQDKYKTLHQLFYTESSLYVFVAESGSSTTDYNDWLQTAKLFGEESPLILIQNEFKNGIGMSSFDEKYWKKQFPNILKEVFTVNLGTKENFSSAEDYLKLLAQTLPHTKEPFPSNWAAIRKVLRERRDEQYISIQEYLKICKENNLPERESAIILSSVLHKIGDCLHYQKSELLNQFIILKNEWATDAVYKILDDQKVAEENCGFFNQKDLERIWSSEEYMDMRPQLLELMKQFRLAYQLPGKQEYVTPPLLPTARPSHFIWPECDSIELFIEYNFLPKALLTQFIVSRHVDIAEGRKLVWRNGVILEWKDEALAEVYKTKNNGRDSIYIKVQGTNRKGMMTVILNTFRELHSEYRGIKYDEKVPCNCEGCKTGQNDQHYFDFANLKFRLSKGKHLVECDKSLDEIRVLDLLENTFVLEAAREGVSFSLKQDVKREKSIDPKLIKIFLASSNELKEERDYIEQAIGRRNYILKSQGFEVELLIWENGKHIGKSLRTQDDYNLEIEQCNFFVMLFHSKVGDFSQEEFNLAKTLFEKNGFPRIRIHQKMTPLPNDISAKDFESRELFLNSMKKIEHFKEQYKDKDELVRQIERAIDKLILDESFVDGLEN